MLSFLDGAPEINDAVKSKMEAQVSGIFCCISGMYADAYHLLEYKTLPKLPSLLPNIPGIKYMLPALKNYYITLLNEFDKIETDKEFLAKLYLDVADSFSRLPFSFENQESIILPFVDKALAHYIQCKDTEYQEENTAEELNNPDVLYSIVKLDYKYDSFIEKANKVRSRANIETI